MRTDKDNERLGLGTEHRWEDDAGLPARPSSSASSDAFDDHRQEQAPLGVAGVAPLAGTADDEDNDKPMSPLRAATRRLARDRRAMVSLVLVGLIVVLSFIGPAHLPAPRSYHLGGPTLQDHLGPQVYHEYTHQELTKLNQPPSAAYWLGHRSTRARYSGALDGWRQGLHLVTFVVVTFDIILGLIVGTLAGYYGGWIDTFLARFTDLMYAFPILLFAILAAATLGQAFIDRFGPSGRLVAGQPRDWVHHLAADGALRARPDAPTEGAAIHRGGAQHRGDEPDAHPGPHRPEPLQHRPDGCHAGYRRHHHGRGDTLAARSRRPGARVRVWA